MIGRATARLEPLSRRWLVRLWGQPSIHTRQRWIAVWPCLAQLPAGPLDVLDAGCGVGAWSLELALRRRAWSITGVDRSEPSLEAAETARRQLAVENVVFVRSDFLDFRPPKQFDVVLSVASAHHLLQEGRGEELFQRFGSWLRPGGLLLLFAPRCRREVPWLRLLPPPVRATRRRLGGAAALALPRRRTRGENDYPGDRGSGDAGEANQPRGRAVVVSEGRHVPGADGAHWARSPAPRWASQRALLGGGTRR